MWLKVDFSSLLRVPYIIIVIIIVIYNITAYQFLHYKEYEHYQFILENTKKNILSLVLLDIETALNPNILNKDFHLLKKVSESSNNDVNNLPNVIVTKDSSLYIKNTKETTIFDLQHLRNTLSQILPNYIIYKLEINSSNIVTNNLNKIPYMLTKCSKIDHNTKYCIKIGTDHRSEYCLYNNYLFYKYLLINLTVSILVSTIFLYCYLKIRRNIISKIESLKDNLFISQKQHNTLLLHSNASKGLTTFFIKKATEEYIKQQLNANEEHDINTKQLDYDNDLFPISFTNYEQTTISITKLINLLTEYFLAHFVCTAIKYKNSSDTIKINCAEHVFYQIIFSLINNLIHFMEDQSSVPKTLLVEFSDQNSTITISYDGFPLTEQIMINLSNTTLRENIDPFLLNCSMIFQSLKKHNIFYTIERIGKQNVLLIELANVMTAQSDGPKVINLEKYKKIKQPIINNGV